jgi:hypothetical protein
MRIVEICMNPERNTLQVKATSTRRLVEDAALAWSQGLKVEVGGAGTLAAAGVVLPRLLADRLGLTAGLALVVARAGFFPLRHRGRALVDAACALAAGATCVADVEAMTAQEELLGPGGGASDSTMVRALDELAERLGGDGLPGRAWPGSPRRRGSGRGRRSWPGTGSCPRCGSPVGIWPDRPQSPVGARVRCW